MVTLRPKYILYGVHGGIIFPHLVAKRIGDPDASADYVRDDCCCDGLV